MRACWLIFMLRTRFLRNFFARKIQRMLSLHTHTWECATLAHVSLEMESINVNGNNVNVNDLLLPHVDIMLRLQSLCKHIHAAMIRCFLNCCFLTAVIFCSVFKKKKKKKVTKQSNIWLDSTPEPLMQLTHGNTDSYKNKSNLSSSKELFKKKKLKKNKDF